MVSEQLVLGFVRAIGNFKIFNKDMKLKIILHMDYMNFVMHII